MRRPSVPLTLLPVALAAAVTVLLSPRPAAARIISRAAEISVGREAASEVEQYFHVDVNPLDVARVRQIGRRLAASAADSNFPFEFHVVDSPEINAFALPGGFVYVYHGLLQLLPNDDTLASVLSHEISHVTQHHSIRQFEKSYLLSLGITAVLLGTGAGANAANAADVAQTIAGISFTRHDEAEADRYGIDLLTRAGYDPRAAPEAMEVLKRAAVDEKNVPALLRSHPTTEARIKTLSRLADGLMAQRQSQRAELSRRVTTPAPAADPADGGAAPAGVHPAACEWLPLVPASRWVYRSRTAEGEATLTVRALERGIGGMSAACRVEYELSRGIKTIRWVVPAGERVLSHPEQSTSLDDWRTDAVFSERAAEHSLRSGGLERVQVPAGEFEARRVERLGADGQPVSTSWYARGVGLIKRFNRETGLTEELTSYHIPAESLRLPPPK